MNLGKPLTLTGEFINNEFKTFGKLLEDLLNTASQNNIIELSNVKFIAGKPFDKNTELTFDQIIEYRIPIMDYLLFWSLDYEQRKRITWQLQSSRVEYNQTQVSFSLLLLYVMIMTRNKALPEENENIPIFLSKFMKIPIDIEDIRECLSYNNLNLFTHTWVKDVDISKLSNALQNRLAQGIAGSRLFSVFRDYDVDLDIDDKLKRVVENIKILVNNGPFWEMHTLFQPKELSAMSINSCLNNLMILCFSEKTLQKMKDNKSIYRMPKYSMKGEAVRNWDHKFFELFTTKLL